MSKQMGKQRKEALEEKISSWSANAIGIGTIPPRREEFAFGYILKVLTQGLYPNVLDVLREYVQNAYDAIIKHRNAYRKTNYKELKDIQKSLVDLRG